MTNTEKLAKEFKRWGKRAIRRIEKGVAKYGVNNGKTWTGVDENYDVING